MGKRSQEELLHPKSVVIAQGVPNFLVKNKGDSKTISRRQKMLNLHFMEGLSDILANESIGTVIREEEVTITHVEVGQHFNILNIFWTTTRSDLTAVGDKLNKLTGILYKKMIERNFMTVIPVIKFNYDKNKTNIDVVNKLLSEDNTYKKYGRPSIDAREFIPPTEVASGYHFLDPLGPRRRAKRVALFEQEFKESQERSYRDKEINYKTQTFVCPEDMRLDAQGFDYLKTMNIVLSRMKRVRSQSQPFVADPLPPSVWVQDHQLPADHELLERKELDTTTRLSTMRQFIVDNRRKKSQKYRQRIKDQEEYYECLADVHEEAQMKIEEGYQENGDIIEDQDFFEEDTKITKSSKT